MVTKPVSCFASMALDSWMYRTDNQPRLYNKGCGDDKPQNRRSRKYSENRTRARAEVLPCIACDLLSSSTDRAFSIPHHNDLDSCNDLYTSLLESARCGRYKSTCTLKTRCSHNRHQHLTSTSLPRGNSIATTTYDEGCEALSNPTRKIVFPSLVHRESAECDPFETKGRRRMGLSNPNYQNNIFSTPREHCKAARLGS
ncbi:hypothetical protein N431DRAFT_60515 [Stipitochalara longipes BDJ]|nr:hypothetical protein N431DRAFT_60515 [Stipitochalara longipes BDJ]